MGAKTVINTIKLAWNSNSVLNQIPLRSSRINTGEEHPYALVKVEDAGQVLDTSKSYIKKYKIIIEIWSGSYLANVDLFSQALVNAFDWKYDLAVAGADVMLWRPDSDDPDLDKNDVYGSNDKILRQIWYVTLNESKIR